MNRYEVPMPSHEPPLHMLSDMLDRAAKLVANNPLLPPIHEGDTVSFMNGSATSVFTYQVIYTDTVETVLEDDLGKTFPVPTCKVFRVRDAESICAGLWSVRN